jgi:hypothetical protein
MPSRSGARPAERAQDCAARTQRGRAGLERKTSPERAAASSLRSGWKVQFHRSPRPLRQESIPFMRWHRICQGKVADIVRCASTWRRDTCSSRSISGRAPPSWGDCGSPRRTRPPGMNSWIAMPPHLRLVLPLAPPGRRRGGRCPGRDAATRRKDATSTTTRPAVSAPSRLSPTTPGTSSSTTAARFPPGAIGSQTPWSRSSATICCCG